ncbi:MAG: Histidine kinase [Candidatus Tokpelaia hoelldobleri]|uniref:histidine kinase n=1 Tax=Candidatus Tokpelaia hoelldobleri TaxID=1902579 RepID=A0A1U9JSM5_9HYPH|nr:MAG: Histidine kinase [Candidatus Tokpelaia hoelldoblerii]
MTKQAKDRRHRQNRGAEPRPRKNLLLRWLKRLRRLFEQLLFSSLTRRIVILNLAALVALVIGINFNQVRDRLIKAKFDNLETQGRLIAASIAAFATGEGEISMISPERLMELQAGQSASPSGENADNLDFPINPARVSPLLRHLISPTRTRVRIYDRDANLLLDSRQLYSGGQVLSYRLPPVSGEEAGWFRRLRIWLYDKFYGDNIPLDREQPGSNGTVYPEVVKAINGIPATAQWRNQQGELVVSVAVPIQRYHAVLGVLLMSDANTDIDATVRGARHDILKIFAVVALVMLILSLFLASTIATPLRRLAAAADRVRHGTNKRVEIPDYSSRQDEIGHLSASIRDMMDALYTRIEGTERFAADVSHELKNPLTSLRSAVETLPLAKTGEARNRLFAVVQHDVRRLDRLITDIADASRLDAELARAAAEPVDLENLLDNLVLAAREVRKNKTTADISLEIEVPVGQKKYLVAGHDLRLGQVISNLIENARSFIPEKGGEIHLYMGKRHHLIFIVIEDNGSGIRVENIERIFERFYTDRPEKESFGQNSGLGLSISRQIIEAHEGTLTAENIMDADNPEHILGARFIIALPEME